MLSLVFSIDDDPLVHMLTEIVLEDTQFCKRVIGFDTAQQALDYFENQSKIPVENQQIPELIFLDINMPVYDGWDFLDMFSTNYPSIISKVKIILLSSSVDPKDKIRANENDLILDFFSKPLNVNDVEFLKQNPPFNNYFI
ncbi:MAG: response regulator, partial [Chitinophagaceae bacterium]